MAGELTPEQWLQHKIYSPVERVRARQIDSGGWEVFDGVAVHTFSDEQFNDTYGLSAQSLGWYEERKQYEYH